ncbi:hypothetical protein OE766_05450 [Pararhizobium sp. YC-54]|uniref:hypothetical protein n=1 Tax=Pararhizobium sp. YC-54 TaxID=2986920 RepID=UPI0021F77D75|nr:hypothetical protein [Pararhizobium sp. YC-54]MCV9997685.1 hypothetical protein [Pararhizobium sp. YC-54]
MVYLDQYSRKFQQKPILTGKGRETAIGKVMDALADWRISPFEAEGEVRAGLRRSFCLAGSRWPTADQEAASLISEVFRRKGVVRPSWNDGQRRYASQGFCYFCNAYLEGSSGFTRKFCSTRCAKMLVLSRALYPDRFCDQVFVSAYNFVYKATAMANATTMNCEQCGAGFRSLYAERFCSKACVGASQRTRKQLPCKICGTLFLPHASRAKFCSHSCYQESRKRPSYVLQCGWCQTSFLANLKKTGFCSKSCRAKMSYQCKKAKAVILPFPTISPAEFDREFQIAA